MWPMVSKTSGSTQAWYCPKATAAVPELPEVLLREIMRPPMRTYDPNLIQEPAVLQVGFRSVFQILHLFFIFSFFFFLMWRYENRWDIEIFCMYMHICRLNRAAMHFRESTKEIINEEFGDGMQVYCFSSSFELFTM